MRWRDELECFRECVQACSRAEVTNDVGACPPVVNVGALHKERWQNAYGLAIAVIIPHSTFTMADDAPPALVSHAFRVGERTLNIQARAFDQSAFLRAGLQTGQAVWPSARVLCDYLTAQRDALLRGRVCVELGCGVGVCGLAARVLGASRVVLTDGDAVVLERARATAAANDVAIDGCSVLRWGIDEADSLVAARALAREHAIDVLLASDVLYGPSEARLVLGCAGESRQCVVSHAAPVSMSNASAASSDDAPATLDARVYHLFALVDALAPAVFLLAFENRGDVALDDLLACAAHFQYEAQFARIEDLFDNDVDQLTPFWARCVVRLQRR